MEVVFAEFERYINIMKAFRGIDWSIYAKMKSEDRKEPEGDIHLLDEEEEEMKADPEVPSEEGGDLEQQQRLEAMKKQEERAQREMKTMHQLYAESFLIRLVRLVEIFTSISAVSHYPLSMV